MTAQFVYDANQQRVQQITGMVGKSETTTYVNSEFRYLHADALGNIDTITDSHGAVLQRIAYSPFGTRQVTASNDPDYQAWTDRGFTGHEHLDGLGLIHMNARLYDPEIGRFLSPDTYIQAPYNSQNYNRYSYVLNNPLKYTDPSGHFFSSLLNLIEKIGSFLVSYAPTIAGIAVAAFLGPGATFLQAVMHGAAAGFVGGLVGSGSLRGALEGAFWGGITAGSARGIGHGFGANTLLADGSSVAPASPFGAGKWLIHGIAQGTISELRGGNFQSGFVGAVAGSVAGGASGRVMGSLGVASNVGSRTAVAGIFGGLAAKASGGSFADGAVSAAFTHLFNYEATVGTWGSAPKPIDWGAIGSAIERPMLSVLGKLLGAIGLAATPSTLGDSSLVTSYKAPRDNQVGTILRYGFTKDVFSGNGAYFSLSPDVAAEYAYNYKSGIFIVNTPVQVFNNLAGRGLIIIDPYEKASFSVSPAGLSEFSSMSTIDSVPPNSFRLYNEFGIY